MLMVLVERSTRNSVVWVWLVDWAYRKRAEGSSFEMATLVRLLMGRTLLRVLSDHTNRVQRQLAMGDYPALVSKVRQPPLWVRPDTVEETMNLVEFFVHHEDVRRAAPGWTPRQLSFEYERRLSDRLRGSAKLSARRFPATIIAHAPGAEPLRVGAGGDQLDVRGAPGELLLFFVGRQRVADVEVAGPAPLADRLRTARLGL